MQVDPVSRGTFLRVLRAKEMHREWQSRGKTVWYFRPEVGVGGKKKTRCNLVIQNKLNLAVMKYLKDLSIYQDPGLRVPYNNKTINLFKP